MPFDRQNAGPIGRNTRNNSKADSWTARHTQNSLVKKGTERHPQSPLSLFFHHLSEDLDIQMAIYSIQIQIIKK